MVVEQAAGGPPTFAFADRSSFSPTVEIGDLGVFRMRDGNWDYRNPEWNIKLSPGRSLPLESVRYGSVPEGFAQTAPARPLEAGVRYQVVAFGPGAAGSAEFHIAPAPAS